MVAGGNPRPPALNDSPESQRFLKIKDSQVFLQTDQ